jgi:hypothetical protein
LRYYISSSKSPLTRENAIPVLCETKHKYIYQSAITYTHYSFNALAPNLVVQALDWLGLWERLSHEPNAALVAAGVGCTREPHAVATAQRVRARLKALVAVDRSEHQVTLGGDLEGAALLVGADGLHTSGVADHALAHAGAVDKDLFGRVVGVQVQATVILGESEGGVVDGGVGAAAVLAWGIEEEARVCSLEARVLDWRA